MKILIITGGDVDLSWARRELAGMENYYVIAVDGGLLTADTLSVKPDMIVGDFDTASADLVRRYAEADYPIERHQPEKDDTDTELALKYAVSMDNAEEIVIFGALGRRFDHALANLEILIHALKKKIPCRIMDPYNRIYLLNSHTVFRKEELYGKYISFVPYTDEVDGLTLKDFKYPLENAVMRRGMSLGISNEIPGESAEIFMKSGIMICIESRDRA